MYPHFLLRVLPLITAPLLLITLNSYDVWFDAPHILTITMKEKHRILCVVLAGSNTEDEHFKRGT